MDRSEMLKLSNPQVEILRIAYETGSVFESGKAARTVKSLIRLGLLTQPEDWRSIWHNVITVEGAYELGRHVESDPYNS